MEISFDHRIDNPLSPNHYVEISNQGAFTGMANIEQKMLIIDCDSAVSDTSAKPILNVENASDVTASGELKVAIDAAQKAYPKVKLYVATASVTAFILPDERFTQIALTSKNDAVVTTLLGILEERWKSDSQLDGHLFVPCEATDVTDGYKDKYHLSLIPVPNTTEVAENNAKWTAAFAAVNAHYATEPSRPYQALKVLTTDKTKVGPKRPERDTWLGNGMCAWRLQGSDVVIDRMVTTFRPDDGDISYRDLNTKQTVSTLRYDLRTYFERTFRRFMLATDDYPYSGNVLTVKSAKTMILARYRIWQERNLVCDPGNRVAKELQVELDKDNPGWVQIFLPVHVMGQMRGTMTQLALRL